MERDGEAAHPYCLYGFSNCYVFGSQDGSDALIVDPGCMDEKILAFIEKHDYRIRAS
jgi:glyoxylase-like metal-dependent hydrolase (beta-lactamase superfamily II)